MAHTAISPGLDMGLSDGCATVLLLLVLVMMIESRAGDSSGRNGGDGGVRTLRYGTFKGIGKSSQRGLVED